MGVFRRAKTSRKPGQYGSHVNVAAMKITEHEIRENNWNRRGRYDAHDNFTTMRVPEKEFVRDDNSIGDELALDDQFDIFVPLKPPQGILKNNTRKIGRQRSKQNLHGEKLNKNAIKTECDRIITSSSTLSSLTFVIPKAKEPQAGVAYIGSNPHSKIQNNWISRYGGFPQSTMTNKESKSKSTATSLHRIKKSNGLSFSFPVVNCYTSMCIPRVDDTIVTDDTTMTDPLAVPINLQKPVSFSRENSLFDSLQDEDEDAEEEERETETEAETETVAGALSTMAIIEMDQTFEEIASVATHNSRSKPKFFRRVPSLPRIRSIPKIRSFKREKGKKERKKKPNTKK